MTSIPNVVVDGGRYRFVIPLGYFDARPDRHVCSICDRPSDSLPGWAIYEPDVECVNRKPRKTRGAGGAQAKRHRRRLVT